MPAAGLQARPLARFEQPGHAVTGDRASSAARKRRRVGYDVVHAIADDHSRFAYAEVLPDAKATTVTTLVQRALAVYAKHGIRPHRLMSDNPWSYTKNRSLREQLTLVDAVEGARFAQRPQHPTTPQEDLL